MKILISIIIILFLSVPAGAQTFTFDTIPQLIPVMDSSRYYDIYYKTGNIKKRNAVFPVVYIPIGGWIIKKGFVNSNVFIIDGFTVYKIDSLMNASSIKHLAKNKGPILPPLMVTGWSFPVDGLEYKQ